MNTIKAMSASMPITIRIAPYHFSEPSPSMVTMLLMRVGIREMMPAKRIIEMPLPMPNSSICSPIHIRKDAPAVKLRMMTRP